MVEWAKPSHPRSPEQQSPSPPTCLSPCLCSRLSWLQAIIQSQPKLLPRASVSFPPTVRQWKTLPNASTFLWSKLTSSEFRTHTAELRPLPQALLPLKSCLEQTPFCQTWSTGLLYHFWLVYSVISTSSHYSKFYRVPDMCQPLYWDHENDLYFSPVDLKVDLKTSVMNLEWGNWSRNFIGNYLSLVQFIIRNTENPLCSLSP